MVEIDDKQKIRNLEVRLRKIKRNYDAMTADKIIIGDKINELTEELRKAVAENLELRRELDGRKN